MTSYGSTYGSLHFNDAFNRFTITIFKLSEDARSIGWSNSNSWIISAPAINRKDAVNLSKNLLLNYYGYTEIE